MKKFENSTMEEGNVEALAEIPLRWEKKVTIQQCENSTIRQFENSTMEELKVEV